MPKPQGLFRLQSEGLATTFHELRTLVSSINGYASILLTGELGDLRNPQRDSIQRVRELCHSMSTLVGNLLTLSKPKGRSVQTPREFVDVARVGQEVLRSLEGEVERKKLRLNTRLPAKEVRFWMNPDELAQILLNLLANAVKFTPSRGRVELEISQTASRLTLRVSDSGVGVSSRDLPKIFEEFYHVDHPEVGASQGSGLGLAIVKRIVQAYQGEIKVKSRAGKGSQFQVTFPIRSEQEILEDFIEGLWNHVRQMNQSLGIILCQVRYGPRSQASRDGFAAETLRVFEQVLREDLRKEDPIFRISSDSLIAVLAVVKADGFSMMIQRLRETLEGSLEVKKLETAAAVQWRLVSVLAPRKEHSPSRLLKLARGKLNRSWGEGEEQAWISEKNS
ncbi:MAG: diguanylate cyclase [Candidatus Omnitrophica bacterium]|nr:diguanylate cyclase [Candidatus Omnitrophota bacterium]